MVLVSIEYDKKKLYLMRLLMMEIYEKKKKKYHKQFNFQPIRLYPEMDLSRAIFPPL